MPTKQFGVDFDAATTPLDGTETLSIVQGGVTVDATTQDIADLASGGVTSVNGQTGVVVLALDDIDDVDAPAPTDGQVLTWVTADSEWQAVTPTGGVSDGDKGDITVTASGATWTIDSQAVTYAKMQNISATQRVLGRNTAGAGSTEEVTFTQFLDWVGSAANGDILYRAGGVWTRLAAGTNGYVLTLSAGLPTWAAAGGGGLTGLTATLETASPNNTVNASYLLASGGTTNQDFVASAKGTGAFQAQLADSTATGGNKRGTYATDFQRVRASATQVASGQYAFLHGQNGISSGTHSVVIGQDLTVSGGGSAAVGGRYTNISGTGCFAAAGQFTQLSANYSMGSGQYGIDRGIDTSRVISGGCFASNGDAQAQELVLRRGTTDATPGRMTASISTGGTNAAAAANQLVLENNSCYAVKAVVVVRQNATGDSAKYDVDFCIKRGANAASTAIVGTATATQVQADAGAATWTVAVTADTTIGCPAFTVTGEAAHTLRWSAHIYACAQVVG